VLVLSGSGLLFSFLGLPSVIFTLASGTAACVVAFVPSAVDKTCHALVVRSLVISSFSGAQHIVGTSDIRRCLAQWIRSVLLLSGDHQRCFHGSTSSFFQLQVGTEKTPDEIS
jgi:hypothetical protein